jgi:hypothetical protein
MHTRLSSLVTPTSISLLNNGPRTDEPANLVNGLNVNLNVALHAAAVGKVVGLLAERYINKENFTTVLLEEGLATVHAYSAEQSGHANEYFAVVLATLYGRGIALSASSGAIGGLGFLSLSSLLGAGGGSRHRPCILG